MKKNAAFPKGFFWGSATSAHQVEGNNVNDWSEPERQNAVRLAKEAKKYWRKWQQDKFPEMFNSENYISGKACDHYNRFEEDFDIAKSLGHNAHRFSVEWSRIEPEEGQFNEKEIEHYKKVVKTLRERGIEPFVTLWHWTQPLWIRDIGGWENKKTIDYFGRYVEKLAASFGDGVKFWIVVNEPNIYAALGYIRGNQPPGVKNIFKAIKVFNNLTDAHKKAHQIIHKRDETAKVGSANSVIYFQPKNNFFVNRVIVSVADYFWNRRFFKNVSGFSDFLGVNYYTRRLVGFSFGAEEQKPVSDLGWEIVPEGIYYVLKNLKNYNLPVYITENGIADAKDDKREEFITQHLRMVHKAIEDGVDVRGYFYWSLLDNFEFPEVRGFWPRFGLVEVDYKTMARTIRPSAKVYAAICKNNGIEN
ncbi:hypothetical protein A3J02_02725 [Candidatus Azambacteria bacterium RIFCSPLOWO2_02_FULL_46_11]|uniref:Beta-glucosidase n=1 Tax=Candidatus Azambacteria bacterium RIFCSPLOWO2_02_FULL_46_11 TaxID=1797300 RepID=A0A1F5CK38_9BACT|nr:MAG: hypothetical protein A3J02_02725 [Candidatus Azambacteria bacterium RIFCSPLOWO2_02_FULL_46_11]